MSQATAHRQMEVSASRRALAGLSLCGLILSFPGAILPAWGHHLRPNYTAAGSYFLAIVLGIPVATYLRRVLRQRAGAQTTLIGACLLICAALLFLGQTGPPAPDIWRLPGLFGLGVGAGLLNAAIFEALTPIYKLNPAGTVNLAGIFLGIGSCLTPLLVAGTFNLYSVSIVIFLLALVPAGFALTYWKLGVVEVRHTGRATTFQELVQEITMPAAVLLSLLLFFHFGNEWAIAGWLPVYLIQRLGLSPSDALILLTAYWFALMLGRIGAQWVLPRVSHMRLLLGSVLTALFGCLVLNLTNNLFGAIVGTLLTGFGFAPVYPLVVERIRDRFPEYHPGFYNGIFSIGITGGMLAPAMLGYGISQYGLGAVAVVPVAGTLIVLILVLVIWLEAWFTRSHSAQPNRDRTP
ncbi:MAG: MFS transporter [Bryobacteraceae bacterium]|nr:MFS transporter [Bryobacteraceae bacterium]